MPRSTRRRGVDVDRDVAVGRQVGVEVRVERQVARLGDRSPAVRRSRAGGRHPAIRPELVARPGRTRPGRASSCSSVWAAVTIVRSRALSMATVGKTTDWAKTPSSRSRSPKRIGGVGVAHHHRRDRRLGAAGVEAQPGQLGLEPAGVGPQPLLQLRLLLHDPDRLAAGGHDGRRVGGREEERPGSLGQDLAQRQRARRRSRRATPTALRQGADLDRDPTVEPEVVDRAAAVPPEHARGVGVVDHDGRAVAPRPPRRCRAAARCRRPSRRRRRSRPGSSRYGPPPSGRPCSRASAQDLAQARRRRRAGRPRGAPSTGACRR